MSDWDMKPTNDMEQRLYMQGYRVFWEANGNYVAKTPAGHILAISRNSLGDCWTSCFQHELSENNAVIQRIRELEGIVKGYREWIAKHVEPMRQLAMEISLKYEPCGYYCDPDDYISGHHDHQLFNSAKFLYGNGDERYTPEDVDDLLRNAH